jgi:hypothetical protein
MRGYANLFVALLLSLLLGGAAPATDLVAGGAPTVAVPRDSLLRLGEFAFDPIEGEPALPEGWDESSATGADLHLVQFDGPIAEGALDMLRDGGLEPVQYIHPDTYIVWGRLADRATVAPGGAIRWTGDFAPAYRVLPQWRDLPADEVAVKVLIYRGADPDAIVATLAALGGTPTARQLVNDSRRLLDPASGHRRGLPRRGQQPDLGGQRRRIQSGVHGISDVAHHGGTRRQRHRRRRCR